MPSTVEIFQVDAFTQRPFTGNPAGVVPVADGLSVAQMQAIARELNNSETAFVLPAQGPDHDVHVRFFTPSTEVPVCGHATIATHHVLAEVQGRTGTSRQLTAAGVLRIEVERAGGGEAWIRMHQNAPVFESPLEGPDRAELLGAARLTESDVPPGLPIQAVSTGHSKVMVPIRSRALLDALTPDHGRLAALSRRIGCNGYYFFTVADPDPGCRVHGRMFAPAIGITEDPVTGNASGPVGAYLVAHGRIAPDAAGRVVFDARQGEALGRPGTVRVEVDCDRASGRPVAVSIAGHAVTVFRTQIAV